MKTKIEKAEKRVQRKSGKQAKKEAINVIKMIWKILTGRA